ncbi:hypothetical protein ABH926_009204 [Catenulispora sp. GP43]|uniref:condensation domain-containing protein n=1 Tax=Catenulispora sp. GP43 TaxID=3156263 RepID=UPI003515708B
MNHPLTPGPTAGQQALWFIQHLEPECAAYNTSLALSLHFTVDPVVLDAAVRATVLGHGLLNQTFPRQLFAGGESTAAKPIPERMLELVVADEAEPQLQAHVLALSQRPFDLEHELPVRAVLLLQGQEPDVLLLVAHHIAADNISQLNLCRRILARYAALLDDEPPEEEDDGAAFAGFVERQREYQASRRAETAREFWGKELAGLTRHTALPTDLPVPTVYRYQGAQVDIALPPDLTSGLDRAAAERNTTTFALLMAAFQVLLRSHSRQRDLAVGYPATLRRGEPERAAIGYFVNTLPLRTRIGPEDSFSEVLHAVSRAHFRALLQRDYPFALLPWPSELRQDPSRPGPVSALFVLNDLDPDEPGAALALGHRVQIAGLDVAEYRLPQQLGQFWLTLQITRYGKQAQAVLKYNTSLFTEKRAHLLAEQYAAILSENARPGVNSGPGF